MNCSYTHIVFISQWTNILGNALSRQCIITVNVPTVDRFQVMLVGTLKAVTNSICSS